MATIGIGEDGEYADGFVRPIKEKIRVPFDDPRIPSLGFFEKGCDFVEGEEPYAQIEQKIDSVVNGRIYNFNGVSVRSTPPMSYIRTLLHRFSSARNDDSTAIARILLSVHRTPQRIARF